MNIQQCPNGHFYDADSSAQCPHCIAGVPPIKRDGPQTMGGGMTANKPVSQPHEKPEKKGFLSGLKFGKDKGKDKNPQPAPMPRPQNPGDTSTGTPSVMPDQSGSAASNTPSKIMEDEVTLFEPTMDSKPAGGQQFVQPTPAPASQKASLSDTLSHAAVNQDDIKTVGFFGDVSMGGEPVVGWLVALSGGDKGNSYTLYTGKNFIGRSSTMDIVLVGDEKVSREKHTTIMYEPMAKKFFVLSSESNGMVYMNGTALMDNHELMDREKFTVGDTTLMFVRLCGDDFDWEEI